jgi:hypothetical protein
MKRGFVLLVLVLLVGASLGAQGYIYNPSNTPTAGGGNAWPFTSSYSAWRFSFIVDASVLPNAPIKITDVALAFTGSVTKTAKQLQVRMGHTTHKNYSGSGTTSFDVILGPCPTIVYDGPLNWPITANQWEDMGLQRSFGYDGKRNVVIDIRYHGGANAAYVRTDPTIPRAYISTQRTADPYNSPTWFVPIYGEMMGPKHRLTYVKDNILIAPDSLQVGTSGAIAYGNGPGGDFYRIAASLGQSVQWHFGKCSLFLDPDGVFNYSVLFGAPIFNNYSGVLSAAGGAAGKFAVPAMKQLVGICVYHAGVAYNTGGVSGCTNTDGTLLTP